ncbi:hypothetical protein TEQG_02510 [Trichophyton equinum CBS 127.97]|uniref:Uncharacterized protein n=1 Tax=Trichophyton equinum (strain ATCC MYA-4606 / CBS 127.97) TaxID=559882 RepID=F2PNL1_TRIEC|nr:hypothetical protein TEQG_02510 [Trichophyton equinum CBS 127.97]
MAYVITFYTIGLYFLSCLDGVMLYRTAGSHVLSQRREQDTDISKCITLQNPPKTYYHKSNLVDRYVSESATIPKGIRSLTIRYDSFKQGTDMNRFEKKKAAAAAATTEKEKAASKWAEAAAAWEVTLHGGPSDPRAGPQHHQRRRRPRPHQKAKLKARRAEKRRQAREKEKEEKKTKEKENEKERPEEEAMQEEAMQEEEENEGMDIPFRQNDKEF